MTNPQFTLRAVGNNVDPQLDGAIGAGDTIIALKTGHGTEVPTILSGTVTSTGDSQTLNDTGDLGSLAVGDFIKNVTDGSIAIVINIGSAPNSVKTTPLEGGSDNTWQNGDTWRMGEFVGVLTALNSDGEITKQERVLVKTHAAAADSVTVDRSFGGDTALTFSANDYLYIMVEKTYVEELQKAVRNLWGKIQDLYEDNHRYAADSGSANAYAITLDPKVTALSDLIGRLIIFKATNANTTASTLAVNGLAATAIKKEGGASDLVSGDIAANMMVAVVYNGTSFIMVNAVANAAASSTITVEDKTADYTVPNGTAQKAFTNNGATSDIVFTLGTPAAGNFYDFIVADAYGVKVKPPTGVTLNWAGNSYANLHTNKQYSTLSLIGISATEWVVRAMEGTWNIGVGFLAGGNDGSTKSLIEKLNFSTEALTALSATLDTARYVAQGVYSPYNGYIGGGSTGSNSAVISKLLFMAETEANLAATLDNARNMSSTGWQNGSTKGYFVGGGTLGSSDKIDNMVFASDTSADLGSSLAAARQSAGVVNRAEVAGYYMGGGATSIYKFTFSGESLSTLAATMPASSLGQIPVWSSTRGYACGGNGGPIATVQYLNYSDETRAQLGNNLPAAREDGGGMSSDTKGYACGGGTTATIYALNFSAETWSTLSATLTDDRGYMAGLSAATS